MLYSVYSNSGIALIMAQNTFLNRHELSRNCTARQCSPFSRKFMECSINNPALSLLMKHLVVGQCKKAPNFSAFHWSPHGSLVSIGQHFVTTNTKTEIEMEADLNKESDQAMRAVHSCNSWLFFFYYVV